MPRKPDAMKSIILAAIMVLCIYSSAFADEPYIKLRCYPETLHHSNLIDHSTIVDIVITETKMSVVRTNEDGSQTERTHTGDFEKSLIDRTDAVWSEPVKNFPSSILSGTVANLSSTMPTYEERATDPRKNGEAVLASSKYCDSVTSGGDWMALFMKAAKNGR